MFVFLLKSMGAIYYGGMQQGCVKAQPMSIDTPYIFNVILYLEPS